MHAVSQRNHTVGHSCVWAILSNLMFGDSLILLHVSIVHSFSLYSPHSVVISPFSFLILVAFTLSAFIFVMNSQPHNGFIDFAGFISFYNVLENEAI